MTAVEHIGAPKRSEFHDHMLVVRLRWMSNPNKYPGLAAFVQTEADLIHLLVQNRNLGLENDRLQAIVNLVELKNERDALADKVRELETARENR